MPERLNGPVLKTGARKCRGFESHPLRHALRRVPLLLITATALLAGCASALQTFHFSFPAGLGLPEVPVVLDDQLGRVVKADINATDPNPPLDEFMRTFDALPKLVMVQWVGSGCDSGVLITVGPPDVTIRVASTRTTGACDPVVVHRAVLIEFSEPLDRSRTAVRFED